MELRVLADPSRLAGPGTGNLVANGALMAKPIPNSSASRLTLVLETILSAYSADALYVAERWSK